MATLEEILKKIDEDLPHEISNDDAREKCTAAIEQLNALAKKHPTNAQVFALRGKIYSKLQHLSEAERDLKKALELCNSTDPEIVFQYGNLQNINKKYEAAIAYFNQCISLSNNIHPKAHNNLCVSYGSLKNYDKALEHICLAIIQDPNNALYLSNRALVYYRRLRSGTSLKEKIIAYQQTIQDLEKAMSLDPSVEKYVRNYNDFVKKLEAAEKELKDKMNAPLDLHLSCSEESTPQPDATPTTTKLLPPPAPTQYHQSKSSPTFFTQQQEIPRIDQQTSKRKRSNLASTSSDASPLILPSIIIPDEVNLNDAAPHPWQSLPPTPTPPDEKTPPNPR